MNEGQKTKTKSVSIQQTWTEKCFLRQCGVSQRTSSRSAVHVMAIKQFED